MCSPEGCRGRFVGEACPLSTQRIFAQPEPHSRLLPGAGIEVQVPGCEHAQRPAPEEALPAAPCLLHGVR